MWSELCKGDDLSEWIATMQLTDPDAFDHELERGQTTRTPPWLIAALTKIDSTHPKTIEMTALARFVNPSAAAFASARFHAMRVLLESGKKIVAHTLHDQLLKDDRTQFDESSLNLL